MVSKTFLLIALAIATVFLITSEVVAARELASNHGSSEVGDAKHDHDDHGYYNDGPGGDYNDGRCGRHHKGDGHGPYYNGGGPGPYYNGGGGHCKWGCCGGERYDDGWCKCCHTQAEATAYEQTHKGQTHN